MMLKPKLEGNAWNRDCGAMEWQRRGEEKHTARIEKGGRADDAPRQHCKTTEWRESYEMQCFVTYFASWDMAGNSRCEYDTDMQLPAKPERLHSTIHDSRRAESMIMLERPLWFLGNAMIFKFASWKNILALLRSPCQECEVEANAD